jgi:hypothetical protein
MGVRGRGELQRRRLGDLLLILGLGVAWLARRAAGVQDGAVLASSGIVPALLYVVLRGDLAELRGPGG